LGDSEMSQTKNGFYRALLRRAWYSYGKLSVCLFVCLPVLPWRWSIVIA